MATPTPARYWRKIKITNPVSLDYPDAKKLAEKAANAGSKAGEITLARILVNTQAGRPDYPKAISLLQKASEDLDNDSAVDAQMLLGLIYANGVGIAADDEKAAWYFKRSSAISRTGYSEYWAGMMFLNGEPGFIEKNKQKALHWLNLSCLEGFDTGCEEFETLTNG
ncbi:tetratricopeptide repeat protein [Salmonella enterica subsp. enterica serovar Choleraesuis str. 0006]|nr:tetratricopeptide repeat protein [Salmonella enterica subsp. enterica serovar Choleraesuis str. 0006]